MLLLSAIALFSPDSPNVVHRDVVKLEQVSAVCILKFALSGLDSLFHSTNFPWFETPVFKKLDRDYVWLGYRG